MKRSVFNSFRQPSTSETAHFAEHNQVVETVPVHVLRLDEVLPHLRDRYQFERPLLKTDTQGFDLEVFRGATDIHAQLVGVQCELAIKRLYQQAPV